MGNLLPLNISINEGSADAEELGGSFHVNGFLKVIWFRGWALCGRTGNPDGQPESLYRFSSTLIGVHAAFSFP